LRQIRRKKGITQEVSAKRSGYHARGWRRIEAGESRPARQTLIERILINGLEIRDVDTINAILNLFDYPEIKATEMLAHGLYRTSDTHM
jgi:transcriptional regulator with XRE-family HTH domain